MTVRVTTLKGAGAGRYYTEHLPSYYLDGDEPGGRWWGRGAGLLGLDGEMNANAFLSMMAGKNPTTSLDLGRRFGEGSVRGYDATFSAPKSVSVLFGVGEPEVRQQVVEAHDRAVEVVLGWVESHAHTRMRHHRQVVTVDAEGIVVGVFRQYTSRKLDPQLHTHAVIANRVAAPDGRWLALDARTIKLDQRTLSALYHANLRSELTRRLGVRWQQPEHGIAEIADLDGDVLAEFSQRTTDAQRRIDEKLGRFRTDLGRDPTDKERWRLEREAVLDSRPSKPHGQTQTVLDEEWRRRVETLGHDPERLVKNVVGRQRRQVGIDAQVAATMVEQALVSLGERRSTWRPAELVRELAAAVPTTVTVESERLTGFLERLADHTATNRCVDISRPVPAGVSLRRDGRPISEAAAERALTTQAILNEEEQLITWAHRRQSIDATHTRIPAVGYGEELTVAQTEAVAAVTGSRGLELIVGPAGTGKTTVLAPAVAHLQAEGRHVFGVAPTAAAAEVLATETGIAADTLDKLLIEHHYPHRPPHSVYDLPAGTTVLVDEAATAATPKLVELARLADSHRWRIVLVGDPRQFSAVGRGGMFAHLIDIYGAVELDQVHRFRNHWERTASLRLRDGDPGVLTEYEQHGRLHGGTPEQMEADIINAWHKARRRGETVALMANNTDSVDRLNRFAQRTPIAMGELDADALSMRVGVEQMLVGDEVVTRRNDRGLRTDLGLMVKNRDHWTIETIHPDRSVTLSGRTGTVQLPGQYVAEDLELGYAQTSHATQGRTVDTALLLLDTPTDSRGVYTPMTRGRDSNHAYVVVEDNQTALDVLTQAVTRDWIDQSAVARRDQLDRHHQRARLWVGATEPEALDPADLSRLIEPRHGLGLGGSDRDDELAVLEQHIRRVVAQRRARTRESERTVDRTQSRDRELTLDR